MGGKLPLIECQGDPRQMGRQQGEMLRQNINDVSFLFSININASSIVSSVGSFSSGIVAFNDLYLI